LIEKIQNNEWLSYLLDLKERYKWLVDEWKMYNEYYKVWNLYYIHWTYHNDAHAKKHSLSYQRSVRYWHLHTSQEYCLSTPLDSEVINTKAIPCLCKKDPAYMKKRPSPWMNGFNIAYIKKDWTFNDYTIIIHDDWHFIYNWIEY